MILEERSEVMVVVMGRHDTADMAGGHKLPHCTRGESFKHQAVPSEETIIFIKPCNKEMVKYFNGSKDKVVCNLLN